MKTKVLKSILASTLAVSLISVTAFAERVEYDDVKAAVMAQDYETTEKLIHTESNEVDEIIDATITVDESNVVNKASKLMLGVHYGTEGDARYLISEDGYELSPDYVALQDDLYDIPLSRMIVNGNIINQIQLPGNKGSDSVLDDIGYENYTEDGSLNVSSGPENIPPAICIKGTLATNPNASFIFCIDVACSYPEDTANFVRFCLDPNGSSEWADLRKAWGIENPINLYGIEVGNEKYFFSTPTPEREVSATEWYVDNFKKHAAAVHAIYPDISMIPSINSNATRGGYYEWNRPVLKGLADEISEISFHLYYSGYELAYTSEWIEATRELIKECIPGKEIKFALTEHAKWDAGTYASRQALMGVLPVGQFLNRMIPMTDMSVANNHCITHFAWAFFKKLEDGTVAVTGTNELYKLYEQNMGDRVLATTVESDSPITDLNSTGQRFSALVTAKGDKGLSIILCNREPYTELNLKFNFGNNYTLKSETVLTAPNLSSLVYSKESTDIFRTTTTAKDEKNFTTYKMPTKSLVCLTLESDKSIPQFGGEATEEEAPEYDGEKVFRDITNHWAENQIYSLFSNGIVNGVSADSFDPDALITRAEFAEMLRRAKGIEPTEIDVDISDVQAGAWYKNTIGLMIAKGIMRPDNGKVNPEDNLRLVDCSAMVYRADESVEKLSANYDKFIDDSNITEWESQVLNYGIEKGTLKYFYETKLLDPHKFITRAEAASIIYEFCK